MSALAAHWPEGRTPPPPSTFDPWRGLAAEGRLAPALSEAGLQALARAVARSGRDREAAFLLLEADGYLTYACEAATEEAGTEEVLRDILRRIGSPDS